MFPVSLQFYFSERLSESEVRDAFETLWFPDLRWGKLEDLMASSDEWPEAVVVVWGGKEAEAPGPPLVPEGRSPYCATVSLPVFPRRERGQNRIMRATKLALLRRLSAHFECRVACDGAGYRRPRERVAPDPDETLLCVGGRVFCGWTHFRDLFEGELHPPGGWTPLDDVPRVALLPDGRIEHEAAAVEAVEAWRLSREIPLIVPGQEYDEDGFLYAEEDDGEDDGEDFDAEFDAGFGDAGTGGGERCDDEDSALADLDPSPWLDMLSSLEPPAGGEDDSGSGSRPASGATPFDAVPPSSQHGGRSERDAEDPIDSLGEYFSRLDAWLHDDVGTTASKQLISSQISLPPPNALTDEALHEKLWEVIRGLAETNIYLHDTNHLTDRELYAWLWEEGLNEKTVDLSGLSGCACHTSPIGSGDEADILVSLTFYDDAEARARWKAEWPEITIPAHRDPPADRDRFLPDPQ